MHKTGRVLMALTVGWLLSSFYYTRAATFPSSENSKNDKPCLLGNGCPPYNGTPYPNMPGQTISQDPPALHPGVAVSNPFPLSANQKFHYYLRSAYGPKSFAFSLMGSGINQARDAVPEWGQGVEGYSKRFASVLTEKIVQESAYFGLVTLFHEDPRYFRLGQSGIAHRSFYAAEQVFIAHKDSGGTRFGYTNLIPAFGSSCISRQWRPDSYHNWGDYLTNFAILLGIDAAKNVLNEFWPDVRRMLHH